MNKDYFQQRTHLQLILILLVISYFVLMFGNNVISLTHPDEVFYIQSAKEMVNNNNWLTPMIFDKPQFEKPFVSLALFAFAIKYFGMTPFVARFWPAFFGILGVVVTYWISWMLFKRKRLSFLSSIIICTSFIYLALSRAVLTDMIFSTWVIICIGFFYFSYSNQKYKNIGIILFFVFSSIAVLTKGILGFTFSAATALIFLIYKKDLSFLKCKHVLYGLFLFLIITIPWHLLMYKLYGQWFIDDYFWNVHVKRLFVAEHRKLDNWYFYLALMLGGVLPWSLLWIPTGKAIYNSFKKKEKDREKIFFLISWIIGIYIFVQPAHSKLSSYIFPVFPAIAIMLSYAMDKSIRESNFILLKICGYLMSVLLIGGSIAAIIYGRLYIDIILKMFTVYIFSGLALLTALILFIFNIKKQYVKMIFSFTGVTFTLLVAMFLVRPYIEPWVSCKDICEVFKKIDNSSSTVLASKFYVRGIRFYTDRNMAVIDINGEGFFTPHPIPFLNTDQKVIDFFKEQPDVSYAVVKEGNVQDLHRILKERPYKIEKLEGIGGKYILRIKKI